MWARKVLLASVTVAVAVILFLLVSASLRSSPPPQVHLDGITLHITYLNGSSQLFGPPDQNACNETLHAFPGPPPSPDCPSLLIGGNPYEFGFFCTGNFGSSPGVWTNFTLSAPFAFAVDPGYIGQIPTTYSASTGLFTGGANMLFSQGEWICSSLEFTMPRSSPSSPTGLWLNATLAVQPTNEIYWPGF